MTSRWPAIIMGTVVAALLAAAACAPAAKPGPAQPEAPKAEAPKAEAPKPAAQTEEKQTGKPAVPAGEEGAKHGGVLTIAMTGNPPGYIPWEEAVTYAMQPVHLQSNMIVQFQASGTLQDYKSQEYWKIVGDLAKSWEQSADGLTWTFRFQDGVKWTDGQPFTCGDAKWSLDTIRTGQDLRRSPRALLLAAIKSIECPDGLTLVANLKYPSSAFLQIVGMGPNMIWPKHVYEGKAGLDTLRKEAKHVGTGPFVLKEFIPGEKWVYERNAEYWKKPYPYLDGVLMPSLASAAVVTALRAARLDTGGPGSAFSGAQVDSLQKECKDCQFWPRFTSLGFNAITVNHQRPPWNTPEVKDAIGYAIDQVKLLSVCRQGWGVAGAGIMHPESPFALPKDLLVKVPGFDLDNPAGNKAKARESLARGGFKPGELELKVPVWAGVVTPIMPCLIEDLEAVGIKVQPTEYETGRMYELASAGDFDIHPWGYLYMAPDPDFILYEHFYTGSDRNYGRYSNLEVDRLIDLQSRTLDPQERKKLVLRVSEIIMKEQAKLFLPWYHNMPIVGPRVRNFLPGPTCTSHGPCMRMERVWLQQQ